MAFFLWGCGPKKADVSCLEVTEMMTSEVSTAGVRTLFKVSDCNGNPVPDVTSRDVTVRLDGKIMQSEGNVSMVLNQDVAFELNTLLLLDMSDSVVQNGHLAGMVAAARTLINRLSNQGHNVAIYRFAGPTWFSPVTDFTNDLNELNAALDAVAGGTGLGTTDLYGAISRGIRLLENRKSVDILSAESMVLFTDGTDEAMAASKTTADHLIQSSEVYVYTVGLGTDVNQEELEQFGKNGFEWAANTDALKTSFAKITALIHDISKSYYLMGICSPRVGGVRTLEIEISKDGKTGILETRYDATDFDIVGCTPAEVAFPCLNQVCGTVDGFICGTCSDGEFCNETGQCLDACDSSYECGIANGVNCGTCAQGLTYTCSDYKCVDACANAQCGLLLGVNCGDCSDYGATYACSETHTCFDVCSNRECGIVDGISCGDCSEYGATFGCDSNGACVDACGDRQCGTVEGVSCGDCSSLGNMFGCNNAGVCVDVCNNIECGSVGDVDCGECGSGETCSVDNKCVPAGMDGMAWVRISGGEITLGCDWSLDTNCDNDEQRVPVTLSDYYIMDSEVTAGMYAVCVRNGGCNAANVATTTGCTFNGKENNTAPINCITHEGLLEFCSYLEGDLPTEAQWENAARCGHDGVADTYYAYPWGNTPAPDCSRVIMNEDNPGCGTSRVFEVRSLQPNAFGLYDMMGNVSEWTQDLYGEVLGGCAGESCINPQGPPVGDEFVVRGGSYNSMYASAFRNAARDKEAPATTSSAIGGRCVREIFE